MAREAAEEAAKTEDKIVEAVADAETGEAATTVVKTVEGAQQPSPEDPDTPPHLLRPVVTAIIVMVWNLGTVWQH